VLRLDLPAVDDFGSNRRAFRPYQGGVLSANLDLMMFQKPSQRRAPWSPDSTTSSHGSRSPNPTEVCPLGDDRGVGPVEPRTLIRDVALPSIDTAIAALEPYLGEPFIPTRSVINPLLVVWDAAHGLDPCVSLPVEQLLTALLARTWVTPSELTATMDEVRALALEASSLIYALSDA
jgi:hypothetical protein